MSRSMAKMVTCLARVLTAELASVVASAAMSRWMARMVTCSVRASAVELARMASLATSAVTSRGMARKVTCSASVSTAESARMASLAASPVVSRWLARMATSFASVSTAEMAIMVKSAVMESMTETAVADEMDSMRLFLATEMDRIWFSLRLWVVMARMVTCFAIASTAGTAFLRLLRSSGICYVSTGESAR